MKLIGRKSNKLHLTRVLSRTPMGRGMALLGWAYHLLAFWLSAGYLTNQHSCAYSLCARSLKQPIRIPLVVSLYYLKVTH